MGRNHTGKISINGFALITVLWVTAFLSAIAGAVSYQSKNSLAMANNVVAEFKTRHAAEGALFLTASKLYKRELLQGLKLKSSNFNYAIDDGQVVVGVADESGKVDLNLAPVELLSALINTVGLDEPSSISLANAIADWRDNDQLSRPNGAEDKDYLRQGYDYQAKDDEFDSIEELGLVLGMSDEIYNKVKPYITVYSQDIGVNISLASLTVKNAVLLAMSRTGGDEIASDYVSSTGGLTYTLQAKASLPSGIASSLSAIIRFQQGNSAEPFVILSWQQN